MTFEQERAEFFSNLKRYKKIGSVKEPKSIELSLEVELSGVFLLTGDIGLVKRYVDLYKKHHVPIFLHLDKISGLSSDGHGLKFVANYVKPTGIISTRSTLIKLAQKYNLLAIQRLFLIDTDAVNHGIESIKTCKPDIVELMPARVPEMIQVLSEQVNVPIITGGLISTKEHMIEPLKYGASAVSTSNPTLWRVDLENE